MKTDPQRTKLIALASSLVVIALVVNALFFRHAATMRQAQEQEKREKAEAALNEQKAKDAAKKLEQERTDRERGLEVKRRADAKAEADRKEAQEQAKADAARQAEADRQRAIEKAAAQHAQYLARYLNYDFERKANTATVAIAIASEDGIASFEMTEALSRRFETNGVQLLSAFFKPAFVADGFVGNIFRGRADSFAQLELTNSLDAVLLGRQVAEYSSNPALENSLTANVQLELMVLPMRANYAGNSWKFVAKGIGFTRHEARMQAEERIIKQITTDTNMTLARTLPARP